MAYLLVVLQILSCDNPVVISNVLQQGLGQLSVIKCTRTIPGNDLESLGQLWPLDPLAYFIHLICFGINENAPAIEMGNSRVN